MKNLTLSMILAAAIITSPVLAKPAVSGRAPARAVAPPPSPQKIKNDTKAIGEWMARLLAAQDKAMSVLTPIDEAWAKLEQVSPSKDQNAINAAYDKIDATIAQAKTDIAAAKSEVDALPSLAANSVMRQLPVGHEARLRKLTLEAIQQFAEIVDRGETMTLAAASGEKELTKEFSNLMLDARGQALSGQRSRIEIMLSATPKGSVNEAKLSVLGKATEAVLIVFKGEVNILRKKPAAFDMARISAIGSEIAAINLKGHGAQKVALQEFAKEKKYIIPQMLPANQRLHDLNAEWLVYADTLPKMFSEVIAAIPAAGNDLAELDKLLLKLVAVEEEYAKHSQKLIATIQGI
jgi:hypothetical protein